MRIPTHWIYHSHYVIILFIVFSSFLFPPHTSCNRDCIKYIIIPSSLTINIPFPIIPSSLLAQYSSHFYCITYLVYMCQIKHYPLNVLDDNLPSCTSKRPIMPVQSSAGLVWGMCLIGSLSAYFLGQYYISTSCASVSESQEKERVECWWKEPPPPRSPERSLF